MPITRSAKKALRQSKKRQTKNLVSRNKLRGLLKQERVLISQKKLQEAKRLAPQVSKALDKAVKQGLIKKNTASRRKSHLAKALAKVVS